MTSDDCGSETLQEQIEKAMPPLPEDKQEFAEGDECTMTPEEQQTLSDSLEAWIQALYDRGYSPSELGIIFNGFGHRMNASRFDPHEYDRIALSITLRETIEDWRDKQDEGVPDVEVAQAVEELGRYYRDLARREVYREENDD